MVYFPPMKINILIRFFLTFFTLSFAASSYSAEDTQNLASTPGKETYQQYCSICHAAGVAGAPRFQNTQDWAPHISHGIDHMLQNAITGLNAMPPKGTCTSCTEQQLKEAIEYMLPK